MDDQKLEYQIGEIYVYAREHRHDVKDLSAKFDGLGIRIAKDIATMEAKMEAKFAFFEERVRNLELSDAKDIGGKSVLEKLLSSPLLAWLLAAAVVVWNYLHGTPTGPGKL